MGAPQLTVVVPVRSADEHLAVQLRALAAQEGCPPWELVLADNGDNTRLAALLARAPASLPAPLVVDTTDRPGPSHARNVGVKASSAPNLVFVDADDEVAPGYLAAMSAGLQVHALVAARVDHEPLNRVWGGVPYRPWQVDVLGHFGRHPLAAAGTLGIRRGLFDEIGGFDESFTGAEDLDLCIRASLAGHPVTLLDTAVLRVRAQETMLDMFRQQRHWGRSDALLLSRHASEHGGAERVDGTAPPRTGARVRAATALLGTRAGRGHLAAELGRRIGRLEGRLRSRA